ncbi:hypothetical protein QM012_002510 [Aureobasidium pullulans]|uniref:Vps72/YL1 C-terminal domain-containing protein n=1 Tax=Aureobasidium pullulans TaxID=5580 RepID=A0ABR0TDH6_AURPU
MTDFSTSSQIDAGSFNLPSAPDVPATLSVPTTPDVLSAPNAASSPLAPSSPGSHFESLDKDEGLSPPTPEGLSRRQYNLFKRNRKPALKTANKVAQAIEEIEDATEDVVAESQSPAGYQKGDFGRQARKLIESTDKHGMLSPGTHKVIKPSVVRYYSYKKDFVIAQRLAERKSRKNGGIRIL